MVGGTEDRLQGVGALCSDKERKDYGLHGEDEVALPPGVRAESTWRGRRLSVSGSEMEGVLEAAVSQSLASFTSTRGKAGGARK